MKRMKMSPPKDDVMKAIASFNKAKEAKRINIAEVRKLRKDFKQTCDATKRKTQQLQSENSSKRAGTTRSGKKRNAIRQALYADGAIVNKGIDDATTKNFASDELSYLKKSLRKVSTIQELNYDQLKFLVVDTFLEELEQIKAGNVQSDFHDRFNELKGLSKSDLLSAVKTSLFTNEQLDYVNGLLQGALGTVTKDDKGDIKHVEIEYVTIVMLAEVTIRIVKRVYGLKSNKEALEFMVKSSREASGLVD